MVERHLVSVDKHHVFTAAIEDRLSDLREESIRENIKVSQTAGRTVRVWDYLNNREQLIYSDTGWRNIDISNVTGTIRSASSPGTMQLRREGSTVTARFAGVGLASGTTQGNFLASGTIPVDFRGVADGSFFSLRDPAMGFATYHTLSAAGSYVRWLSFWDGATQSQTRPTGGTAGGEVSWHTDAPWPTSLPGTAVGTIPYQ